VCFEEVEKRKCQVKVKEGQWIRLPITKLLDGMHRSSQWIAGFQ
jgi:hypothetical protein